MILAAQGQVAEATSGMSSLVNSISHWVNIIFITLLFVGGILSALLYYFIKIRKVTSKVERIDYSSFNRVDAEEYVKFEDIVSDTKGDLGGAGMIVLGNNVFVGGISVVGYNLASADSAEQQRTMINAISFFNVVEQPIQMRQTVKAVDLSHNIDVHKEILEQINLDLMGLSEEYNETLSRYEDNIDDANARVVYEKRLDDLQKEIRNKRHSLEECEYLINYMGAMTKGKNRDTQKINQIMFSYTFNPDDYSEELTKEEIYIKAFMELNSKANAYSEGLAECGCTCKRLTAEDLIGLMRKHMSPFSADDISLDEMFDSSYNALFVTSDSLIQLEQKKRTEEYYAEQVRAYQKHEEELRKEREMEFHRTARIVRGAVVDQVNRLEGGDSVA